MTIPSTNVKFSEIQQELGGRDPTTLTEYYSGGKFVSYAFTSNGLSVPSTIPASGAIRMTNFYNVDAPKYKLSKFSINESGVLLSADGVAIDSSNNVIVTAKSTDESRIRAVLRKYDYALNPIWQDIRPSTFAIQDARQLSVNSSDNILQIFRSYKSDNQFFVFAKYNSSGALEFIKRMDSDTNAGSGAVVLKNDETILFSIGGSSGGSATHTTNSTFSTNVSGRGERHLYQNIGIVTPLNGQLVRVVQQGGSNIPSNRGRILSYKLTGIETTSVTRSNVTSYGVDTGAPVDLLGQKATTDRSNNIIVLSSQRWYANGRYEVNVTKQNSNLEILWSKSFIDSSLSANATFGGVSDICTDELDNIYVLAGSDGRGILKYTSSGNLIWAASSSSANVGFRAIAAFADDQIVVVGRENANAFILKTRTDFTSNAGTLSDEIRLTYNLPDIITYDLPVALGANPGFTASGPLFSTPNTSIAFNALANATTNTVTFGY
jgi:hypothetical protein